MNNICNLFKNNIKSFIRGELKGDPLRRFCYHYKECSYCRDVLLDDFIIDMMLKNLDDKFKHTYEEELDMKINKTISSIKNADNKKKILYLIYSIIINIVVIVSLIIIIRKIYL